MTIGCHEQCSLETLRKICEEGQVNKALQMLNLIDSPRIHGCAKFFYCLLEWCIHRKDLASGRKLWTLITRCGLGSNSFLGSHFIRMFAFCGSLSEANQVFNNLPRPNLFAWSAIISANTKLGHGAQAINLYEQMKQVHMTPDGHIFAAILNACADGPALLQGNLVHVDLVEEGLETDLVIGNTLIDMYSKCGSLVDAWKVFDNLAIRDLVTWSAMIAGFAHQGHSQEALQLFQRMQERGVKPSRVTWNAIIAGFVQHGHGLEALQFFQQMQKEGMDPNHITFISILKSCSGIAWLDQGRLVHSQVMASCFESDLVVGNALIDMYAKCGSLDDACQVFNRMPKQDVVTWSTMIGLHAQHGECQVGIRLFQQMQQVGIVPNSITLVSILKAYSDISDIHESKLIHAQVIESGFESEIHVGSALIDMYIKCGNPEDAQRVLDRLPERNMVAWNAIIAGYAKHHDYKSAKQCFEALQQEGLRPNIVTFVSLLSACSHVGSIEEGLHHFQSMRGDHRITPTVDHYNCFVDILGRAGLLNEATDLLETVPSGPNIVGWKSLLGHCRIHGNMSLARECFHRIITIDHGHAVGYVLMSSLYADGSNLEDANSLEELRRCTGV